MINMPIIYKKNIIIFLFYLTMLVIGFGSVSAGVSSNNTISSFFAIFFAVFLLFFNKCVWENINFSLLKSLVVVFFSFCISCFFSVLPDNQQNWMRFYAIFSSVILGYFFYILMIKNIISFVGISCILALIGLIHVFVLLFMWFSMPTPISHNWVTGLYYFNNIRNLTDLLSICFLSAFFLMYECEDFNKKILWFIISVIILSCILWSGSRTAYLGLFVSFIAIILYSKKRLLDVISMFFMVLIALGLSCLFIVDNNGFGFLNAFSRSTDSSGSINQLSSGRIDLYKNVFELFTYHPVFGYGGDAIVQLKVSVGKAYFLQAHNAILQILIEFGMVGLLSVLFVFYKIAMGFRYHKLNNNQIYSIIIIFNIIVASLVNGGAYYVVIISLTCLFIAMLYAERALRLENA